MQNNNYSKPDFWSQKAHAEGYPARSVYKLIEIDEKYHLLHKGSKVLDIGAAPGSWSMYTLKKIGDNGFLLALDLQAISLSTPESNFLFLQGDLYADKIRRAVQEKGPYKVVMSDAAPRTTGSRIVDQAASEAIVEAAIEYGLEMLAPGGNFVVKIFQSGAERNFLSLLRKEFNDAHSFKPKACRTESFETYLIARGRKK